MNDPMLFLEDEEDTRAATRSNYKILIVDDEPDVHEVTRLALGDIEYDGMGVEFLDAYSAAEAREILEEYPDIALILLDVVMESDHSGLEFVRHVREQKRNHFVRIVLRTGQPGQAPERKVILDYDIDDYKEKTELSAQKLFTTAISALRGYTHIMSLERNRLGLEKIVHASSSLYSMSSLEEFLSGVLQQLEALLCGGDGAFYSKSLGLVGDNQACDVAEQRIIASTGEYADARKQKLREVVEPEILKWIEAAAKKHQSFFLDRSCVLDLFGGDEDGIVYMGDCERELDEVDRDLVRTFSSNAGMALHNLYLRQELDYAQREVLFTLGEIAEFRSNETSRHVARVGKFTELLARLAGLSQEESETLLLASTMHDIGKLAIPDNVLSKPGKLDADEWQIMKTHAELGYKLLSGSKRPLLRAAAIMALSHHERWDGQGYPAGLAGEAIPLYGRLVAIADVYDALSHKRCYKQAWNENDVLKHFQQERGQHFDPHLVDLFLQHQDAFRQILIEYGDRESA